MVSVIIPAYDSGKYLAESIESVLRQSMPELELIVIDDGSTDATGEIVSFYKDGRIVYIRQENKGVSAARNAGLLRMRGDFFCFLDADDVLPANSLASRLEVLRSNPETEFVDGRVHYYDLNLQAHYKTWMPSYRGHPLQDLVSLSGKCFFGNTWLVRRRKNLNYRFLEGLSHGEDLLFFIEIARSGGLYDYTDDCVLHYRTGGASAMSHIEGLYRGYRLVYEKIAGMPEITEGAQARYRSKSREIMLKSLLRSGRIRAAYQLWRSRWPGS